MLRRYGDLDRDLCALVINACRRTRRDSGSRRRRLHRSRLRNKHRSAVAAGLIDNYCRTFISQKTESCRIKLEGILSTGATRSASRTIYRRAGSCRVRCVGQRQKFCLGVSLTRSLKSRRNVAHCAHHHDLALELAFVLLKLSVIVGAETDDVAGERGRCGYGRCRGSSFAFRLWIDRWRWWNERVRSRRPCLWIGNKRKGRRAVNHRRKSLERPASSEGTPRL